MVESAMGEHALGKFVVDLQENSHGVDLALSSFACAAASNKRASCCNPFPPEITKIDGERDYKRTLEALGALPSLELKSLSTSTLSPRSEGRCQEERPDMIKDLRILFDFLLSDRKCRLEFRLQPTTGAVMSSTVPPLPFVRPTHIFERCPNNSPSLSDISKNSLCCYHGTSFNRIWSILHHGLQASAPEGKRGPLSNVNNLLAKNGQIYGHGIYLTTNPNVALTFSETAYQPWEGSVLGAKVRVVLVCALDTSRDDGKGNKGSCSSSNQHPVPDDLPPHYLLVRDTEAIKITHILIWTDEKHKKQRLDGAGSFFDSLDFFKLCIIAYIAFLILQSLLNNKRLLSLLYPQ